MTNERREALVEGAMAELGWHPDEVRDALRDAFAKVEAEVGRVPCPECVPPPIGPDEDGTELSTCPTCSGKVTVPEWYAVLMEAADVMTSLAYTGGVASGGWLRDWARKRLEQERNSTKGGTT